MWKYISERSNDFSRWTITDRVLQGDDLMVSYGKEEEGNKQHVGCRKRTWFCFGCCLLVFFTPVFSGDWDAASRQNLTASKIRSWKSSAVTTNVKSNLFICFGASGQQGQLQCCYFLFQIKESVPCYHRNHQPNYKEFCSLDKSHHFSFLPTLIQVPKILAWIWS